MPAVAVALLSCSGGSDRDHSAIQSDTIPMRYARQLVMTDCGDYVRADFRNPWDTTRTMQTLALVPRDKPTPKNLPEGAVVVPTPLERSVVYTTVHTSLIDQLGEAGAIVGVCDPRYILKPSVRRRIDSGAIADCGPSVSPNIERILSLKPEAILVSAYENSHDHNRVAAIGIPIIDCIDYMENSPLARAEWMRFFGRLYGRGEMADSMFAAVERQYLAIKRAAAEAHSRPKVMSDRIYGATWDMPCAQSTAGVLIEDAGARNAFAAYSGTGSVQLAPEEVLFRAADADIWLIKYSGKAPLTRSSLGADNPLYTQFKPYSTGEVYGCNVDISPYFEEAAFHPQRVLAEYVSIFHPEITLPVDAPGYYFRLDP